MVGTPLTNCTSWTYDLLVVHEPPSALKVITGDARWFAIRKLVKPKRVDPHLPQGPQLPPPSLEGVMQKAEAEDTLDHTMNEWYSNARLEWDRMAGTSTQQTPRRFKWEAAVGPLARPWSGSSSASVTWTGTQGRRHHPRVA